ncbi:MAG: polyprenyl synthetase family protein [Chloroflexi bacterium]|nr:polyprenyl synthetase family protein [Chloroflexota bacterium]
MSSESSGSKTSHGPSLPQFFERYQPLIAAALRDELQPHELPLYTTLRYYLGWVDPNGNPDPRPEGKALRPTLCLLACEAVGGNPEDALPAAVALEYIHNFSLIHDDIQDQDEMRRHRKTVWAIWGEPVGIVSGNTIFSLADLSSGKLTDRGVDPATSVAVGRVLAERYLKMMEGQFLDISFESRLAITTPEYLDMIQRKTGALIECSIYCGALIGAGSIRSDELIGNMRALGRELGYIFQIRDDLLGIWGGPATGKPVGADIQRKKKALPAVHALDNASGAAAKRLRAIYSKKFVSAPDVEIVLEIMDDLGTREHCESLAREHWDKALHVIESVPLSGKSAHDLRDLGEFLLIRES